MTTWDIEPVTSSFGHVFQVDKDGTGSIDLPEFLAMMAIKECTRYHAIMEKNYLVQQDQFKIYRQKCVYTALKGTVLGDDFLTLFGKTNSCEPMIAMRNYFLILILFCMDIFE